MVGWAVDGLSIYSSVYDDGYVNDFYAWVAIVCELFVEKISNFLDTATAL